MRLMLLALILCLSALPAYANCSGPVGNEGDMIYNGPYKVVQFCDGTNWVRVGGGTNDPRLGTLTANKWCAANAGGTGIDCTQDTPTGSDDLGNHTATQALDMATFGIINLADPTVAQGAATKAYVDSLTGANETDPEVNTLTGSKWCAANAGGTAIDCTQDAPTGADNLGNHTATQNINLGSYWLSGDGGDEGIRVDASGRVGIGTAPASTYKAYILGNTIGDSGANDYQRGLYTYIRPDSSLWTQTNHYVQGITAATLTDALLTAGNTVTDNRTLYVQYGTGTGTAGTVTSAYGLYVQPYQAAGTLTNAYDIYMNVVSGAVPAANHWGIYQANTAKNYFGGNVGIGVTSPAVDLHVAKNGIAAIRLDNANGAGGGDVEFELYSNGSQKYRMQLHNGANLAFVKGTDSVAAGSALYLASDGNVGVGTTSPGAYKLNVNGDTNITGNLNVTGTITPSATVPSGTHCGSRFVYCNPSPPYDMQYPTTGTPASYYSANAACNGTTLTGTCKSFGQGAQGVSCPSGYTGKWQQVLWDAGGYFPYFIIYCVKN